MKFFVYLYMLEMEEATFFICGGLANADFSFNAWQNARKERQKEGKFVLV